jgi:UDP-GlcNAc:undecaprenyl-phosphate GlcNAc-1-phosphate transferase
MLYFIYFFLALVLALVVTPLVRHLAVRLKCVDLPRPPRNLHSRPIPKLGGLAVFIAFILALCAYLTFGDPDFNIIPLKFFAAIGIGAAILMVGGYLDDRYDLPAKYLWIFPAIAALVVVYAGIGVGITFISNPFGGPISLKFAVLGIPASAIFVWFWMVGMMFTTKFLDGIDGLTGGISCIAGFALFLLSLGPTVNQPMTATLAIIFCGALIGYLVYSFHPATIFFGEGGSTLTGFILGALSIILGGKIATALLVMGIPILDVAWVITQRVISRRSPFIGDRLHLHFRLLDLGFSQRQTVLILYAISALFGLTAVYLQSFGKLVALLILFTVMIGLGVAVVSLYKKRARSAPSGTKQP